MSSVAEIESAIEKLPPEDLRTLHHWISERTAQNDSREWTPEELTAAAQRMIDEPDRTKSDAIKAEIIRGFYGPENALSPQKRHSASRARSSPDSGA